jgi:hypothetical protein
MEVDFNRPFVRVGGMGGRPSTPSCDCGGFPARPQSSYETVFGASSVLPLAGRSRPGGPQGIPPQGGLLLPSTKRLRAHATTGHMPTCGGPPLPIALGSAWDELRWLFSLLIHFVSGQERTRLFPGQCSAYSNYTKQTSRTRA